MNMCQNSSAGTKKTIRQLDQALVSEKIRCAEFASTIDIVQELDSNKPEAFPLLYEFKKEDMQSQIQMTKEEEKYYKLGKNDPAKIAGIERMQKQALARKRHQILQKDKK